MSADRRHNIAHCLVAILFDTTLGLFGCSSTLHGMDAWNLHPIPNDTALTDDTAPSDSGMPDQDTAAVGTTRDTASTDTGSGTAWSGVTSDTGDSGGSMPYVTICYEPGEQMSDGELYLAGSLFNDWYPRTAATAWTGDWRMCATEPVVSGETLEMNAWWTPMTSSGVEWAAYNNECASIDWQGTITVDSTEVTVSVAPWSSADWASDPCHTGGNAFFNAP